MMSVTAISKQNFESEVLFSKETVLLDFWADWCGPCRMLAPVVEEIAQEKTALKVGKVNVDQEPELAQQYGIVSIPTLILFQNGTEVKRAVGARSKQELLAWLDQ